jgi:ABC-type nitrate/sulfonate/bicarbonate transport system permease component
VTLALIFLGFVVAFALGFIIGALLGQRHSGDD